MSMVALVGTKGRMTQLYDEKGQVHPVTAVRVGKDCIVVRKRTVKADGYEALQLGIGKPNPKRQSKAEAGVFKHAGLAPHKHLREVRFGDTSPYEKGQHLTVDLFKPGDKVAVIGMTKGRGFAGGVQRWGWSSGPRTHGSMSHRRPGSVGSGSSPGRVLRGRHLPGHYGVERVTVKNLKVIRVEPEKGVLYISGAVPGQAGNLVVVRKIS